jgi:hypothetical protein
MQTGPWTDEDRRFYDAQGYVFARGLLQPSEIESLLKTALDDPSFEAAALARRDGEGGVTRLKLWNSADDDLFGRLARSHRIVDRVEQLLGGEAYFYHSKMMLKEPRTGGAWAWHQDYGYWYNNGCLFPDMLSAMIAVDRADRENGCLQVLAGSHKMGRMEHGKVGDQTGADPERVEQARKVLPLVYCEMNPGDVLFFHCNLLHRSDQNRSARSRWSYICCYNAASNNPYKEHHHPRYLRLEKCSDAQIQELAAR